MNKVTDMTRRADCLSDDEYKLLQALLAAKVYDRCSALIDKRVGGRIRNLNKEFIAIAVQKSKKHF